MKFKLLMIAWSVPIRTYRLKSNWAGNFYLLQWIEKAIWEVKQCMDSHGCCINKNVTRSKSLRKELFILSLWKYLFELINHPLRKWLERHLGKVKPAVDFRHLSVVLSKPPPCPSDHGRTGRLQRPLVLTITWVVLVTGSWCYFGISSAPVSSSLLK